MELDATMSLGDAADHGSSRFDYEDPMGFDRSSDRIVLTTMRGLARVALVASEAASRVERCGTAVDAMEWMREPRPLFSGRSALEACTDRDACAEGVLAHMLGEEEEWNGGLADVRDDASVRFDGTGAMRLFSCRTVLEEEGGARWCFDAFLASDAVAATRALALRRGSAAATATVVREGFDRDDPFVEALVAPRLADAIELAARDPGGWLAAGLEVSVVQRLAS